MIDKNLEETRKRNQQSKQGNVTNSVSGINQNLEETRRLNQQSANGVGNPSAMSNSIGNQNLQQTGQVASQSAYEVMNRNGMINSVDPVNQNLQMTQEQNARSQNTATDSTVQTGNINATKKYNEESQRKKK